MEMIQEPVHAPSSLKLTEWAEQSLASSAKWAKFLSIVGFICCGLLLLIALFAGTLFSSMSSITYEDAQMTSAMSSMNKMGGVAIGIIYGIIAVLYFFPCLYLYRFADKMVMALRRRDENTLSESLNEQKKMYQFIGVMTIVLLSIYALIFIGAMFVGGMAAR